MPAKTLTLGREAFARIAAVERSPRRTRRKPCPRFDCRVYFADEAPAIGCGWRGVTIRKLGPKWAHIMETATGTRAKLRRAVWDALYARATHIRANKGGCAT